MQEQDCASHTITKQPSPADDSLTRQPCKQDQPIWDYNKETSDDAGNVSARHERLEQMSETMHEEHCASEKDESIALMFNRQKEDSTEKLNATQTAVANAPLDLCVIASR